MGWRATHADHLKVNTRGAPLPPLPPPLVMEGRNPSARASGLGGGHDGGLDGRAKRTVSVILGVVVLCFAVAGVMIARFVDSTSTLASLEAGECVRDWLDDGDEEYLEVFLVHVVDCDSPHALEVFAINESLWFGEAAAPFPGDDATFAAGDLWCADQLSLFIGDIVATEWSVWTFVPAEQSWNDGDRSVQCLVGHADEETLLTGSVRNDGTSIDT